jgi:hypothetical protein
MKVLGFRRIDLGENIKGYELANIEIPLDLVIKERLVDVRCIQQDENAVKIMPRTLDRHYRIRYKEKEEEILPRLSVKRGRADTSFIGFLTYKSQYDLIQFLISKYIPDRSTEVDKLIRTYRHSKRKLGRELSALLFKEEQRNEGTFPLFPAFLEEESTRNFKKLESLQGESLFHYTRYFHAIFLEKPVTITRIAIPLCRFLVSEEKANELFYWDGDKLQVINTNEKDIESIKSFLGEETVSQFDRDGYAPLEPPAEIIPLPGAKVVCLIRVPSRKEAGDFSPSAVLDKIDCPKKAKLPLFLLDTRGAIKIPEDTPVITDIWESLYILSRIQDGIYLPDDYFGNPVKYLREKEYFLAGLEVSG